MSNNAGQPSTAPGRDAPGAPATNSTTQPADAPPKDSGGGIGGNQSWMMLVMFAPIVLVLFLSRNQNKKQKAIEASLKIGDEVVTQSGVLGRIAEMDERIVKLEVAPGVKIKVLKSTVQGQSVPAPDKDKDAKSDKDAKAESKDKSQEKKA